MENVIDFALERAKRKSGIKDTALLKDIIDEGFDPCNSIDCTNYFEWKKFQSIIVEDEDIQHNWTDEAIDRLWNDLKTFDEKQTVTIEFDELFPKDLDLTKKPE
tara:strand:+ start:13506 stop:13817 length:312 start_codon:yes stop_codon:yes gene_type:complete